MKKIACFTVIFALAVTAVFSGGGREKKKASGGGPTGRITIYTSMYRDIVDAVSMALLTRFPDCQIEFQYGGTGTIQAKIASEQATGKIGCDILMVAEPAYSLELKENGILHPYLSGEAGNIAFDYDRDGYWYPVRVSNMVLAYNPDKTPKNTVPNSFYDFANDAGMRGAVSMSNPLSSGTALATVTALRDKYGYDYFDALGKQGVVIESSAVAVAKLEKGEHKVIMILEESILKKREEEKSRLEVIYPADGTVMIPSTIMIVNDQWNANGNIKAAEAITDWFLSAEGQNTIVDAWMHSVRSGFPRLPYDSIPTDRIQANSLPVNWENCYRDREEIRTKFEEFVTNRK